MNGELLLFYLLAAATVGTALAMVTARNVIHAVLFMVLHFGLTGVLYLILRAPFLAMVQVIVYAGAIMVLFLFVVMLLGSRETSLREPLGGQRLLGITLLGLLGALLVFVVAGGVPAGPPGGLPADQLPQVPGGFGSPSAIGALLYTDYVLPVEIVSVLLLIAMIGAVVLARFRHEVRGIGPTARPDEGG